MTTHAIEKKAMKQVNSINRIQKLEELLGQSRYLLGRELGDGGQAFVYAARDVMHPDLVAVKAFRKDITPGARRRLLRQISMATTLSHSNLLPVFDWGEADGIVFYTMPFADGGSLRQRLSAGDELSLEEVLRTVRAIAEALAYLHDREVVHADVKAENILFVKRRAMLSDAGIGQASSTDRTGDVLCLVRLLHEMVDNTSVDAQSHLPSSHHYAPLDQLITRPGPLKRIPDLLERFDPRALWEPMTARALSGELEAAIGELTDPRQEMAAEAL